MSRTPATDATALTAATLNALVDFDALVISGAAQSGSIYGTLATALAAGAKHIKVLSGTFAENITVGADATLEGNGWDTIITGIVTQSGARSRLHNLQLYNSSDDALRITASNVHNGDLYINTPGAKGIEIESAVTGVKFGTVTIASAVADALSIGSTPSDISFESLTILSPGSDGIAISGGTKLKFGVVEIDTAGGHGVNMTAGEAIFGIMCVDGCTGDGVLIAGTSFAQIGLLSTDNNGGDGLSVEGTAICFASNVRADLNTGTGVDITSTNITKCGVGLVYAQNNIVAQTDYATVNDAGGSYVA